MSKVFRFLQEADWHQRDPQEATEAEAAQEQVGQELGQGQGQGGQDPELGRIVGQQDVGQPPSSPRLSCTSSSCQ